MNEIFFFVPKLSHCVALATTQTYIIDGLIMYIHQGDGAGFCSTFGENSLSNFGENSLSKGLATLPLVMTDEVSGMAGLSEGLLRKVKLPIEGRSIIKDDKVIGLALAVGPTGRKSFLVRRGSGGHYRKFGEYPHMPLSEARRLAALYKSGFDLFKQDPEANAEPEFSEVRSLFLFDAMQKKKERTASDYRRLLERHFDFSGGIESICRHRIMQAVDRLSRTPSEQRHAYAAIKRMMNWAVERGYIESSPVPRVSFPINSRDRILNDDEIRSVWHRASEHGYPFGSIVRLLILTGQRRSEIGQMRWNWIREGQLVLPAQSTKNNREHKVPLSSLAQITLAELPQESDLVFPRQRNKSEPFGAWGGSKLRFDAGLDIEPYVLHDIRRTFSSNLARLGVRIEVTERILNHASGAVSGVAAVYNRYSFMTEMRDAMDRHDALILDLLS